VSIPENPVLSAPHIQKLQEFDFKRQSLELMQRNLQLEEEIWLMQTSAQLGVDLHQYHLNSATGACTPRAEFTIPDKTPMPKQIRSKR